MTIVEEHWFSQQINDDRTLDIVQFYKDETGKWWVQWHQPKQAVYESARRYVDDWQRCADRGLAGVAPYPGGVMVVFEEVDL